MFSLFNDDRFRLELFVVRLIERVERGGLALFDGDDHIRLIGEAGMIEVVARRLCRVVGMRMIVADDLQPVAAGIRIGAFVLFRRDPVAVGVRFLFAVITLGGGNVFAERFDLANRFIPFVFCWVDFV